MKHLNHQRTHSMLLACCLAAGVATAHAQDTTETTTTSTTTSTTTAIGTSTNTESKLSAEFADFLGGEEQASSVVSGLRQGTAFSLETETGTTGTTGSTTTTTIDPPTGTMGYGNIRIALRLAQAQLSDLGITQPTADQLSAVLVGGEINGTQVDGILTLRADGMGWGQIAQQYGTTVGQLMGKGSVHAKQPTTPLQSKSAGRTTAAASGKTTSPTKAHANGYIPSGKGLGGSFVTAAGDTVSASGMGGGKGQTHQSSANAHAHGVGVTSAGGQHVSMTGASHAGGGSSASAPGQAKKN